MNIRYPVQKADQRNYKNYDELLTDIRKNAHGWWLLIRSVYKPDEQNDSSWLTLYSLYMHMAPLLEYPKRPLYQVTQKGHGVRMCYYFRYDDRQEIVPDVMKNKHGHARTLMPGEILAVLRQASFTPEGKAEPFVLIQRVQSGKPAGELFWVSMRAEFLQPDGECGICLPDWMHKALNHGVFDDVVPPVTLKVMVKTA